MKYALLGLLALLSACASADKIGSVGSVEYFSVGDPNALSPSFTALVEKRGEEVKVLQVYGSDGWLPSLWGATFGAGGEVGAAAMFGHSLKPTKYNSSESTTVSSGSESDSSADADAVQAQGQQQEQEGKGHGKGYGKPPKCEPPPPKCEEPSQEKGKKDHGRGHKGKDD